MDRDQKRETEGRIETRKEIQRDKQISAKRGGGMDRDQERETEG
jgi:hypothetical protein